MERIQLFWTIIQMEDCAKEIIPQLSFINEVDLTKLTDETYFKFTQLLAISQAMFPGECPFDPEQIHQRVMD